MSLNGLILAGGKSARMGQDKSTIIYHDVYQVEYLARMLKPFVQDIYVSIREDQQTQSHFQSMNIIIDRYRTPSPLNGIVSAMDTTPQAGWLVVAVDMPNIMASDVEMLVCERDISAVATCYESPAKGGPDPLFAIWEHHAYAELRKKIDGKDDHVCPRGVLKEMKVRILSNMIASEHLINVNTPEERDAFLKGQTV